MTDLVELTKVLINLTNGFVELTNELMASELNVHAGFLASLVGLEEDEEINRLIKLMNKTKETRKKKKLNKRIIKLIADTIKR